MRSAIFVCVSTLLMAVERRWLFTQEELTRSPSRLCGIDADKELNYRQQTANFIQDMGQRLQVYPLLRMEPPKLGLSKPRGGLWVHDRVGWPGFFVGQILGIKVVINCPCGVQNVLGILRMKFNLFSVGKYKAFGQFGVFLITTQLSSSQVHWSEDAWLER